MDFYVPLLAIWVGAFGAMVAFGYVLRWAALAYEMLRSIPPPKYCAGRSHRSWWLAPFVLLNPIPWLLLTGPFLLYRVLSGPHASFWTWFLVGGLVSLAWMGVTVFKGIRNGLHNSTASAKP